MKLVPSIIILYLTCLSVFAQTNNLDSLSLNLSNNDLFQNSNQWMDSIQANFYQRSDSLQSGYSHILNILDSTKSHLQNRVDSVASLHLSTSKITNALDSVNQLREKTIAGFNERLQSMKDQSTGKLRALKLPPELDEKASSITASIEGFNISTSDLNLTSLNLPDNPLGQLNDLNLNPSLPVGDNPLESINTLEFSSVTELKNVTGEISQITEVTEQVNGYSKEAQQLAKGNLGEVNNLSDAAENRAVEMSGITDIKDQAKVFDEYKDLAEQAKDPEAMKEVVVQKVQQAAINHFAGKEQQLQQAMETVAKYKKQYASVPDISKLPKKRPNEMKEKPLIERLVPGIAIQIQKEGEDLLVDFNPYVGYRFTGRITAGLGWNQRISYNTKQNDFNSTATIYGPRVFGEYDLWKGFFPRAEAEVMNTFVSDPLGPSSLDVGQREWVWGVFVGLKKDYKIAGRVRGTAMIMTRLFDPHHKSPYGDVINARFGFEFPMKKKMRKGGS